MSVLLLYIQATSESQQWSGMEQYNSYGHSFIFCGTNITPPSLGKDEEEGEESYSYANSGHDSDDEDEDDYCPSSIRDVDEEEEEEYSRDYNDRHRRYYGSSRHKDRGDDEDDDDTLDNRNYSMSKYYTTFGPEDVDPSGDDFNPFGFVNQPHDDATTDANSGGIGFGTSESVEFASFTDFGEVNLSFPNVSSSTNDTGNDDPFGSSTNFDFGFASSDPTSNDNNNNSFDPFNSNNNNNNKETEDPFGSNNNIDPFADFVTNSGSTNNTHSEDIFR